MYTCEGRTQLTGASKYSDILSGQTSEIYNHFMNGHFYSGLVNISRGYYYLGVQTLLANTNYIINSYIYPASSNITLSNWELQ